MTCKPLKDQPVPLDSPITNPPPPPPPPPVPPKEDPGFRKRT